MDEPTATSTLKYMLLCKIMMNDAGMQCSMDAHMLCCTQRMLVDAYMCMSCMLVTKSHLSNTTPAMSSLVRSKLLDRSFVTTGIA